MSKSQQGNSNGGVTALDLDTLSLEQLHQLQQSEEARLQTVSSHYATLRATAARFQGSKTALIECAASCSSNSILVPLTESLYVPGKIRDPSRVLVELGTGFYVDKSNKDAQALLDRKIKLVDVNSENIREIILSLRRNLESIQMAIQGKLLEIRAKQEGVRTRMMAPTAEATVTTANVPTSP
jgi:prefoldin alpha subunit